MASERNIMEMTMGDISNNLIILALTPDEKCYPLVI